LKILNHPAVKGRLSTAHCLFLRIFRANLLKMLVIREEQIQFFIATNEAELVKVIAESVRQANAERVADYDDKALEEMVKIGIERARWHELKRAEDIAAFVAVMFEIAPNFDEQEEIKVVLEDTNQPPSDRFYQIWDRTSDEAWQKAERDYNLNVWFPVQNG
jgi:hypothetical protein